MATSQKNSNTILLPYPKSQWWSSVPPGFADDAKDVEEEVDDVQVELNGCRDVVLRWHPVHDHVGVKDEEKGEQHRTGKWQHKL